jgi:hypothetical protein
MASMGHSLAQIPHAWQATGEMTGLFSDSQ